MELPDASVTVALFSTTIIHGWQKGHPYAYYGGRVDDQLGTLRNFTIVPTVATDIESRPRGFAK